MKLYEAIRLGAMLKPQCFGHLVTFVPARTCALGAALDAVGTLATVKGFFASMAALDEHFPELMSVEVKCPGHICVKHLTHQTYTLAGAITHLNDYHHWTREQIADWVEQMTREHASSLTTEENHDLVTG